MARNARARIIDDYLALKEDVRRFEELISPDRAVYLDGVIEVRSVAGSVGWIQPKSSWVQNAVKKAQDKHAKVVAKIALEELKKMKVMKAREVLGLLEEVREIAGDDASSGE